MPDNETPEISFTIVPVETPNISVAVTPVETPGISVAVTPSQTVTAPVDSTLAVAGMAADAKAAGDAIRTNAAGITALQTSVSGKVNKPATDGTSGQALRTNGDGTTEWASLGLPTDAQTAEAVSDWLDEHPEATTTVQDGSITLEKINSAAIATLAETKTYLSFS